MTDIEPTTLELSGDYFDGHNSRPHAVAAQVDRAARALRVRGETISIEYSLDVVRVSPRLGSTRRSLSFPDGAQLQTADQTAVAALESALGGSRSHFLHWLESRWLTALAGLAVALLAGGLTIRWGVPLLADRAAQALPAEAVQKLGHGTLATLDRALFSPSELSEARRAPTARAFDVLAAAHPELRLELQFRSMGTPNAFALPDGTIVMGDELVELSSDPRELEAVLLHEVGHVVRRHALRRAIESSAVALIIATLFGDATQITGLASVLPALYVDSHYSQSHETEADTFALEEMQARGIPTHHFASIMRKLSAAAGDPDGKGHYLSSHPPTEERIRRFE